MHITDVRFRKLFDTEPLKAVCSVTVDDLIAIHDIKLVSAKNRIIVVMPTKRRSDGIYVDVIHPINAEARKIFEDAIITEYERVTFKP